MIAFRVFFAVFSICTFVQGQNQTSIYGMQGLRIFGDTAEKRDFVGKYEVLPGFDFLKFARATDSPIEVLVAPNQLEQFKNDLNKTNIKYEVAIEDVSKVLEENLTSQRRTRRLRASNILMSFPRYAEIMRYLKNVAKKHKNIAKTFSIGKSYEGRDLLGLKISRGMGSKPVVVIDAGIHAREWIAPTTALYAIQQLVENPANHKFFQNVDIYVIPLLNPDGYEFTHQSIETRLWRKTRSLHSPYPGCEGVDANRNFDIAWMKSGSSSDPCNVIYAGPKAFSEPETVALRDFLLSLKGRIKAYISLHSHGEYLLHPWGFSNTPAKTVKKLKCIAQKAASALSKHRGKRYQIGSPVEVLYAASGGSMDWAMAYADAEISYTIELPGGVYGFAPPLSEISPVGRETLLSLRLFDTLKVLKLARRQFYDPWIHFCI